MFKTLAAVIALSLALVGTASAGTLEEAYADAQAGNYKAAVTGFRRLAEQGDADSQSHYP